MKKMLVVDGNSIMFRAYYATAVFDNLMMTKSGLYTNAVYGFVNMINSLLNMEDVTNIFIAFDKGKKTLRHQVYDDYKGGRKPTPQEFLMQIPYIKQYLDILGIKHLELDDYEADDIVGSMAMKAKDQFDEVMVISGDRDLLQLTKDNVHVYLTKSGVTVLDCYTEENFREKLGIDANQIIDYKSLLGDKSDNLPGVDGIGPKKACTFLNQYGTLEGIYEHLDEISPKTKQNFINCKEKVFRTQALTKLYLDVDIPYSIDDTKIVPADYDTLRAFYEKLEFNSFIKALNKKNANVVKEEPTEASHLSSYIYDDLAGCIKDINAAKAISIEVEFSGENYHKSDVLGLAVVVGKKGYFIDSFSLLNMDLADALTREDLDIYTVDSKRTYIALKRYNIEIKKFAFDVLLGAYIVNPSYTNSDIASVFKHFITCDLPYIDEIYGKKAVYKVGDVTTYGKYAMDKAFYIFEAKKVIDAQLKENDQLDLLYKMELPLAIVLANVELNGFRLNKDRLDEIGEYLNNELERLRAEIYKEAMCEFNIDSPKQLGDVLFEKLGLPYAKKNKTGYSTNVDVLNKLAPLHPVPRLVLEYRKYSKLYSTYVVGLINEISPTDKCVHTIFKQALTLTGRLSSTEPNIQNIPVRTDDGRLIRSAFISSFDDGILVSADYSQIELRVLASLANCKHMLDAFNAGLDLHGSTASKIFNIPIEEITSDKRRIAKAVNFGIVYGMSAWGLAEEVHISNTDASNFIKKYFEIYPEINGFLDGVIKDAITLGYTKTIYNRRRYIPELKSSNRALKQFGERTAKNAPIQGSAADIIKLAMIEVFNKLKAHNLRSKMVAQVHDELIIDCPKDEVEEVSKLLKDTMENVVKLKVKLIAEVNTGSTWGDM